MISSATATQRRSRLHILPRNQKMDQHLYKEVLTKHLRHSMTKTRTNIFQQDGAPCHKSRMMMAWFDEQGFTLLDWPGQSPDMNPIENLWTAYKRILFKKFKPPRNMRELENRMHLAWNLLAKKKKLLANLTDSSQRRVAALLEAEGGSTKY